MFGISAPPSPAFSVEAQIEGDWRPVVKLLACRPKDPSDLPASVVAKWAEYGGGCMDSTCTKCGRDIVLGPRQALAYDREHQEYLVCCLICATIISIMYGDGGAIDINHLGGE